MFLDMSQLLGTSELAYMVEVFLNLGFEITQAKAKDKYYEWNTSSRTQILAEAVHEKELSFQCVNTNLKFEMGQHINWDVAELGGKSRAWIQSYTFDTAYFWNSIESSEKYSQLLLTIGTRLYDILMPTFGWIDFNFGVYTSHEDLESAKLPALYWANFFGPRYISKFGEDKIRNAPGWKIDRLSNNGYLYVLSSGLGLSDDIVPREKVQAYFGVRKVR
jgi:hypothetical protein